VSTLQRTLLAAESSGSDRSRLPGEHEVRELDVDEAFPAEEDRAVIAWCDALVGTGSVAPASRDRLRQGRPDHVVVELTLLAATTLLLNRFCTALELPTSPEVLARLATAGMAS